MKKTRACTLHFGRRGHGVIHLYGKNGSKTLFQSTVHAKPGEAKTRRHKHLYDHLDRLLRAEGV